MSTLTERFIKDPIHDMIPLTARMSHFIDTPAFQRLRYIKQLGTTYYVWAGASHNRFEHCIGVAHLARLMVTHLRESQPELEITERDVECVTLAGLCHDLGHGPWSHVWDSSFIPTIMPGTGWTHEEGSEMMLDFLIQDNLKKTDISPEDVNFIKALIAGEPERCSQPEKRFLFDIVANKRNGLDVDKFDYIQRDSHALGDPIVISIPRLIASARVIEDQICYEYKDLNKVFEVFQTRHRLHKNWYNHKTAKAIEYMIIDGLTLAEPVMNIANLIRNPEEFLYLTDDLMQRIQRDRRTPGLEAAREVFNRITYRDLYKCVDQKWVKWDEREAYQQVVTVPHILECARGYYTSLCPEEREALDQEWADEGVTFNDLTEADIIVEQSTLHYGMKEKNPLDNVKFYSKKNPNCCYTANDGDYSTLRPYLFAEVLLRVYTKKAPFFGIIQKGYRMIPDLESSLVPDKAPSSVEVGPDGKPRDVESTPLASNHYTTPPPPSDDALMSPPETDVDLATSEAGSPPASARRTSGLPSMTRKPPSAPRSSVATLGSSQPSLENIAASSKSISARSTPGAGSPSVPPKTPGKLISTHNVFTTVLPTHSPNPKKRPRGEGEERDLSPDRHTRSSLRRGNGRDLSPSPSPRKHQRHA